jgi:hypothetical protein
MYKLNSRVLTFALICGASVAASASSPNEELPAGPAQEMAANACLSCHEARIIVQQRLSKAAWTREVDKMTKWGAPVDPKDHDALVDYLSANFGPEQPPYTAPKTASETASKSRAKAKH